MSLHELLSPSCIRVPLGATDKKSAIDELVDMLADAGKVSDPQELKDAVWTREQARTTGIGYSLAIPHGKSAGVPDLAMAIGKPGEPIDFSAIDNKPVRLIVLLASPLDRTSDHIQALARISRLMASEEFRSQIYQAETPEQLYELLQSREMAGAGN